MSAATRARSTSQEALAVELLGPGEEPAPQFGEPMLDGAELPLGHDRFGLHLGRHRRRDLRLPAAGDFVGPHSAPGACVVGGMTPDCLRHYLVGPVLESALALSLGPRLPVFGFLSSRPSGAMWPSPQGSSRAPGMPGQPPGQRRSP